MPLFYTTFPPLSHTTQDKCKLWLLNFSESDGNPKLLLYSVRTICSSTRRQVSFHLKLHPLEQIAAWVFPLTLCFVLHLKTPRECPLEFFSALTPAASFQQCHGHGNLLECPGKNRVVSPFRPPFHTTLWILYYPSPFKYPSNVIPAAPETNQYSCAGILPAPQVHAVLIT